MIRYNLVNKAWTRVALGGVMALGLSLGAPASLLQAQEGEATEPTTAVRYFMSGAELMQNFRYLDAAEQFRLAIDEDPEYIDAYKNLAFVFTKMAESESEYYEDALELYEELESKLPDDTEFKKNKAFVLIKLEEKDDAISTYEEILEIDPEDCQTMGNMAELHLDMAKEAGEGTPGHKSNTEAAILAYKRVTDTCDTEIAAFNKLGELYFAAGRKDEAAAVYDAMLEKDPNNADIAGRLGYLWAQDKNYEKAEPYFAKVLEIDPTRTQYRAFYAKALKENGKSTEAANEYLKIIAEDPEQAKLYCNVGFTYLDAKEYEKAIEMAMKAISENAPSQDCLYCVWGKGLELRGNAQVQNYEFDRANSTYSDAKAKFTVAMGSQQWGSYATKQITRVDQLIERAKSIKLKADQDGK
ncbi:MAG: tetratricopeptide repeat protein [Candidatus Eisenbacteria bacterium]|uniref:Tetratricopeptide repeat protein n=1 Tax=Eiseniibacteriota bacterium TaxID=2212470 RepID=A0A7Y2E5Z0_UNCEI|nr:tetratricopeptide repeat protein [Candidatus Eisenbacteria bacterium]